MSSDLLVFDSIAHSNMSTAKKSMARKLYEKALGVAPQKAIAHASATLSAMRQGGESLITGGALGALHAHLPEGLDYKKVPIDGAVAAVGLLGSIVAVHDESHRDARNVGSAAAAVFAFRKAHDFVVEKKIASGTATAKPAGGSTSKVAGEYDGDDGDFGSDPIVACARRMK